MVVYYEPKGASGRVAGVPVVIATAVEELLGPITAAAGPIGAAVGIGTAIAYGLWELFGPKSPREPTPVPMSSSGQSAGPPDNGRTPRNPGYPDPGIRPPVPPCTDCKCPQFAAQPTAALVELAGAGLRPTAAVTADDPSEPGRCSNLFDRAYRDKQPWVRESCLAFNSVESKRAGCWTCTRMICSVVQCACNPDCCCLCCIANHPLQMYTIKPACSMPASTMAASVAPAGSRPGSGSPWA